MPKLPPSQIGRRPSWTPKWQPGRHRLSGRGGILAETLRLCGNRVVTNKLVTGCVFPLGLFPARLELTPMLVRFSPPQPKHRIAKTNRLRQRSSLNDVVLRSKPTGFKPSWEQSIRTSD